jgi:hypothetical protein
MKKNGFVKKGRKVVPPSYPEGRSGHIFLESDRDEALYVIGGYTELGPKSDVWAYQPSTCLWQLLANEETSRQSPLPRFEFDGCVIGSSIYIFGGFESDGMDVSILNDLWMFDTEYQSWTLISEESPAPERSGHVVVAIDNGKFIVHGGTCMCPRNDLWIYDTGTKNWLEISCDNAPCARSMHSAVYCKESKSLAIFGGVTQQGNDPNDLSPTYLNDLWIINLDNGGYRWSMIEFQGLAPSPRDLPAMVAIGDGVIIFGGFGYLEIADDLSEFEDEENDEIEVEEASDEEDDTEGEGDSEGNLKNEMDIGSDGLLNSAPLTSEKSNALNTILSPEEITLTIDNSDVMDGSNIVEREQKEQLDKKRVYFDTDISNGILKSTGEEEDDDDESITMDYLADSWYINLNTSSSNEFDITKTIRPQNKTAVASNLLFNPRRGCKLSRCKNGTMMSFGGFDGVNFYGKTEIIDLDLLNTVLSTNALKTSIVQAQVSAIEISENPSIMEIDENIETFPGKSIN